MPIRNVSPDGEPRPGLTTPRPAAPAPGVTPPAAPAPPAAQTPATASVPAAAPDPAATPDPTTGASPTPPGPDDATGLRLAVPAWVVVAKAVAALVLALVALLAYDTVTVTIAAVAAAAVVGLAVRDALLRVRVRVDRDGVELVRGLRRRSLPWSQIERVTVFNRRQRGIRAALLEFDAGEEIFQYSRTELGTDPYEALDEVARLCPPGTVVDRPDNPYED